MMKTYTILFLMICMFFFIGKNSALAQDEKDTLTNVTVLGNKLHTDNKVSFIPKINDQKIERKFQRLLLLKSVDEVLQKHSSVFVNQYGVNAPASMSVRGTSPAQNLLVWEGVPIHNAQTGFADISLLQSGAFSNINIYHGSQGSLYGSGAMGGVLSLNNDLQSEYNYQFSLEAGSFHSRGTSFAFQDQKGKNIFRIAGVADFRDNNFPYKHSDGTTHHMTNAKRELVSAVVSHYLPWNWRGQDSFSIKTDFWTAISKRGIPPALFESASTKFMQDNWWRAVSTLRYFPHKNNNTSWYTTVSYLQDRSQYDDSATWTHVAYTNAQWFAEVGYRQLLNKPMGIHELLIFTPLLHQRLQNISKTHHRTITGLSAHYKYTNNANTVQCLVNSRQEFIQTNRLPLVYGASINITPIRRYIARNAEQTATIGLQYQKAYRLPTLNELYIFPGGNSTLQPESSHNYEASLQYQLFLDVARPTRISYQVSYFYRYVQDWIYWLGGSIWTPYNISKVKSRGWNHSLQINKQTSLGAWYWHTDFAYTIATTESIQHLNAEQIIGKQLPYTPRYLVRNSIGLQNQRLGLHATHSYTGYRFYNLDEQGILKPFHLLGAAATFYFFQNNKMRLQAKAAVDNICNTPYQLANGRPMPGRAYQLGIIMEAMPQKQ